MSAGDGGTREPSARPRRVTLKDVGRLSNVTPGTVTRALRRDPRVPEATRTRIEAAARQLGYRPDHVAQALVTGRSRTIGLLIPAIGDLYWAEVVAGMEDHAGRSGFSVLLATTYGDPVRAEQRLELLLGKRVDGLVVADSAHAVESALTRDVAAPAVVVGWDPPVDPSVLVRAGAAPAETVRSLRPDAEAPPAHVAFDDLDAGRQVVRHLLGLGHRRIAFLGGQSTLSTALRLAGGGLALAEAGLAYHAVSTGASTLESGRAAALDLLRAHRDVTAVVAYDDLVAIGAVRAARALRVQVPETLSIVGFDDIELTDFVEPTLTSFRQPKHEMGRQAVHLLLDRLERLDRDDVGGPGDAGDAGETEVLLRGSLVPRESSAAPAAP